MIDWQMIEAVDPQHYAAADPFPHIVLHDLIDADVLRIVASEFPEPAAMESHFANHREMKYAESRWDYFGDATEMVLTSLNSNRFVDQLARIAGIDGLRSDDSLLGGGIHQIVAGGLLGIHADFNLHDVLGFRRLNVLVYLNDDWQDDWGGHLELWDSNGCHTKIAPSIGTVVIFSTSRKAMHGHPHPLACPPDRARRSLATYYYAAAPADPGEPPRSTLFFEDVA
jgi:Rps23 Pro-64 3,4-dihydroxylase Tpa1-like proline 4-hydroxylase